MLPHFQAVPAEGCRKIPKSFERLRRIESQHCSASSSAQRLSGRLHPPRRKSCLPTGYSTNATTVWPSR
jgi:hypothetical protein